MNNPQNVPASDENSGVEQLMADSNDAESAQIIEKMEQLGYLDYGLDI